MKRLERRFCEPRPLIRARTMHASKARAFAGERILAVLPAKRLGRRRAPNRLQRLFLEIAHDHAALIVVAAGHDASVPEHHDGAPRGPAKELARVLVFWHELRRR